MYRYHRGPRRIFWLFLGGLAATLWLKGKEKERRNIEWSSEPPRGWWHSGKRETEETEETEAERVRMKRRKEERERIAQMSSQATDTVADVSEAALDTILSTVETLKSKLSEHRDIHQKPEEYNETPEPSHRV